MHKILRPGLEGNELLERKNKSKTGEKLEESTPRSEAKTLR